jgi:hypothetical protein
MKNFSFTLWNRIMGWSCFLIALITYALTVEPTASFWDAGEYIATAAKLEVGHPPGAPLFQMVGAFFSTFASDETNIALMVNLVSSVSSAFTILFLFWSISLLARKISGPIEKQTGATKIAILGSALVGSLAFTFSDSFWFSSAEAEVYAMASLLMAVLFYVGLLWERDMFKPRGNRWLILITFIIGLSFGVHFMALLTIPAIGFLYFFKNVEKITVINFIVANVVVVAILMFIFKLLLPYSLTFFAETEVFFVNSLGLPFNSGTIFAFLALAGFFFWSLTYTRKKNYIHTNTLLLCVLFIFVGFSCYVMLPIRSSAKTTINENKPDNARALLAYYNREQYGDHALFYGPQFTDYFGDLDAQDPYEDDKPKYEQNYDTGKYEVVNNWKNAKSKASPEHEVFLPRMWSTRKMTNYIEFTGPLKLNVKPEYQDQQRLLQQVNKVTTAFANDQISNERYIQFLKRNRGKLDVAKPSTASNFQYFFEYQIGYMYFRYFFWNFVGRQDDIQGKYGTEHGNWLSGIDFIDEWHLGSQDNLPSDVKNNPARNTYYFLPLILGLIGFFFHFSRDKKSWWVMLVFFLFTGIALKFYLNERAFEPRERDYALVGSFYVFAIWMGFGVYAIFDALKKYLSPKIIAPLATVVCLLAVPVLMASENWDDHDRSGKYTATAMAKMYLDSVEENAILFTIGDNDTFALWYAQEVEGYRTDVRVINTSLFATSWYIDQMKRKAYDSPAIKTELEHKNYAYGTNDVLPYRQDPRIPDTLSVKNFIKYIKSDNKSTQAEMRNGQTLNTFPTKHLRLPVNKQAVLEKGIVDQENSDEIVPYIPINISGNRLIKSQLLMLDAVSQLDWKRPVYFSGGSYNDEDFIWMKDYLELEGVTYQLVPIKTPIDPENRYEMGRINADEMYENVMSWDWGNSGSDDIYHDTETRKNAITYRGNLARLSQKLIRQNKTEKARKVMDLAMEKMPVDKFGRYTLLRPYIQGYFKIGDNKKAQKIWDQVVGVYQEKLDYYIPFDLKERRDNGREIVTNIERYRDLLDMLKRYQNEEFAAQKIAVFNNYLEEFSNLYGERRTRGGR